MAFVHINKNQIFVNSIYWKNLDKLFKPSDIKQFCTDNINIIILTYDNEIIYNSISSNDHKILQKKIKYNENIKQISIVKYHNLVLILFECGKLYILKYDFINNYEELLIMNDDTIISISSCYHASIIHKKDGLYYFGLDKLIELKDNNNFDLYSNLIFKFPENTNTINISIYDYKLIKIINDINIKKIHGESSYFIIQYKSEVRFMGIDINNKNYCDIIFPSGNSTIKKISCSPKSILILTTCGCLYNYTGGQESLLIVNPFIVDCWTYSNYSCYITWRGEIFSNMVYSKIDKSIKFIKDFPINLYWSPQNHNYIPIILQKKVFLTLTLFKYLNTKIHLKLPRPLIYIIIKLIVD